MNKEIIKAMNKREIKIDTLRKWWSKNGYKVNRVIFFPVWLGIITRDKITIYLNSREKWGEERVKEILNYYIPRVAQWNKKDKRFYFFDNGCRWSINYAKKYLKRKDRRFWNVHSGVCGGKIRRYLIDKFELDGFEKEICNCEDGWTGLTFTLIEK